MLMFIVQTDVFWFVYLFVSLSFLDDCTHMVDYDHMIIFCNRNL